jgi:hypothetical protein
MTFAQLLQKEPEISGVRLGLAGETAHTQTIAERWRNEGGAVHHFKGSIVDTAATAMKSVHDGKASLLLFDGFPLLDVVRQLEEHVAPDAKPLVVLQGFELDTYDKIFWTGIAPFSTWDSVSEVLPVLRTLINALETLQYSDLRVALVSCVETISPGIPSTVWEGTIAQMSRRGQFGNVLIDGPLGFDMAISPEAAKDKGVETSIEGRADLLILPSLNTFCSLVDALHLSGRSVSAGVVMGTPCPIALPSRFAAEDDVWLSMQVASLLQT